MSMTLGTFLLNILVILFTEKLMPEHLKIVNTRQRMLYAEHWRRVRRQIANECCNQPCTIGNIIWYCGDSSKLVMENPEIFEFQ